MPRQMTGKASRPFLPPPRSPVAESRSGVHVRLSFTCVLIKGAFCPRHRLLLNAANGALAADGNSPSGNPNRAYQEFLKNALDKANNNLSFVQPQACPVAY